MDAGSSAVLELLDAVARRLKSWWASANKRQAPTVKFLMTFHPNVFRVSPIQVWVSGRMR
jgi:hypothetical protein